MSVNSPPSVFVVGGHDPSGAGIHADIETCAAFGCHAACVVTAVTAQSTRTVVRVTPVAAVLIADQIECLLSDRRFAAGKIGLVPDRETLGAVRGALSACSFPLVVDPVLAAGSGPRLTQDGLAAALVSELLPAATVCTPNLGEARALTGRHGLDDIGACLNQIGCEYVLLTGADEPTEDVRNYVYRAGKRIAEFTWKRLPHRYHGSGCTLATGIAACLAQGMDVVGAVEAAQSFTWHALNEAFDFGGAQRIPNRRRVADRREPL